MASDRVQRRIERLLDQIDAAEASGDWQQVYDLALDVLAIDEDNREALAYRQTAERRINILGESGGGRLPTSAAAPSSTIASEPTHPTSFAAGRYQVKRFLGEGGKKRVYLAHDTTLDRDVGFALIKTEGLDQASRTRIQREAQAIGRLGDHHHIMPIHDLGEDNGQPYMVLPLMSGGDVGQDRRVAYFTHLKVYGSADLPRTTILYGRTAPTSTTPGGEATSHRVDQIPSIKPVKIVISHPDN